MRGFSAFLVKVIFKIDANFLIESAYDLGEIFKVKVTGAVSKKQGNFLR